MSVWAILSSPFQKSISVAVSQLESSEIHRRLHIAFRPTFWHLRHCFQWLHLIFLYLCRVRVREKQIRIVSATLRGG
jgi:hypothetical protein